MPNESQWGYGAHRAATRAPSVRAEEFLTDLRDAFAESGVVNAVVACVMANMGATTTARVPDGSKRGYNYGQVPDPAVQLTAARLAAELTGMLSKGGVSVSVTNNTLSLSVDARTAELESIGVPVAQLRAEIEGVLARIPAGENPSTSQVLE